MRFNFLGLALLPAALATPLPALAPSNPTDAAIAARDDAGVVVVPITPGPITPRGHPNIYRCDAPGWQGRCFLVTDPTTCHNWTGEPGAGSFGPDRGLSCRVWGFPDCQGPESATISYPGTSNNEAFAAGHGFTFASYKCHYT